jgi:hypothetical protein
MFRFSVTWFIFNLHRRECTFFFHAKRIIKFKKLLHVWYFLNV